MKKMIIKVALAAAMIAVSANANAQLGNLVKKAQEVKQKAESAQKKAESVTNSGTASVTGVDVRNINLKGTKGETWYVSALTGSARADGKTPETAVKNLQKAIDLASDGDVILVAEGNYLGNNDCGYVENGKFGNAGDLGKFISIIGGYSGDFSERDPHKYITKFQPGQAQANLILGASLNFTARHPNGYAGPVYDMVIDGLTFDYGELNKYVKANMEEQMKSGTPNEGALTGRLLEPQASVSLPVEGWCQIQHYALHLNVEDNLTVRNCTFVNCNMYGLQGQIGKGKVEVCNNVFVACRYAACALEGSVNDKEIDKVSLEFHHNTVLFSWCRTKDMEDMGQGFRFMNRIRTIDVHHNIFGCCNRCGVERVKYESSAPLEKAKVSNLWENWFFANQYDMELANGTGAAIGVSADKIEEAEIIGPKYEGNRQMPVTESFDNAVDHSYLEGFMSLSKMASAQYDPNSAANRWNRTFGLNQTGTSVNRVSMYCNKYPWEKAFALYGAVQGYGAQMFE